MKCPASFVQEPGLRKSLGALEMDDELYKRHLDKLYNLWQHIKGRCYNPNDKRYDRYGGRGITMHGPWRMSFHRFATGMGLPPEPTGEWSVERENVDGNYSPSNCSWANAKIQANNRSTNVKLQFAGMTHTISEWADLTGIDRKVIQRRIAAGWPTANALTVPVLPPETSRKRAAAAERRANGSR